MRGIRRGYLRVEKQTEAVVGVVERAADEGRMRVDRRNRGRRVGATSVCASLL